jgi:hypothetical protein
MIIFYFIILYKKIEKVKVLMSGPITKDNIINTSNIITKENMYELKELEHLNARQIYHIYYTKVNIINDMIDAYIDKVIFKMKYVFVYETELSINSTRYKLSIIDNNEQKIVIIYNDVCAPKKQKCYRITLYQNNTDCNGNYYQYNSCSDLVTNTIPDEIFNSYSDDRKAMLEIFSKKESVTILEKIYKFYNKLHETDYIYNFEKCIIILAAAKYKINNIPYDIAKIITYYTLQ